MELGEELELEQQGVALEFKVILTSPGMTNHIPGETVGGELNRRDLVELCSNLWLIDCGPKSLTCVGI